MHPRHFWPLITLVIGIALGVLASSFWLSAPPASRVAPSPIVATSTYHSSAYHFALDYPSNLAVSEYAEGDDGSTIVFQQPSGHAGFQVFVSPENGALSTETIVRQHPGMTVADIAETIIGTSTGAFSFTDNIPGMGDMYEVWFSQSGRMYEFVTFPYLDHWLTPILASFRVDAAAH